MSEWFGIIKENLEKRRYSDDALRYLLRRCLDDVLPVQVSVRYHRQICGLLDVVERWWDQQGDGTLYYESLDVDDAKRSWVAAFKLVAIMSRLVTDIDHNGLSVKLSECYYVCALFLTKLGRGSELYRADPVSTRSSLLAYLALGVGPSRAVRLQDDRPFKCPRKLLTLLLCLMTDLIGFVGRLVPNSSSRNLEVLPPGCLASLALIRRRKLRRARCTRTSSKHPTTRGLPSVVSVSRTRLRTHFSR